MTATVYVNARVVTLDPARPRASAVRVEGDRVTHVGADDVAALDGRKLDVGGAAMLPGLVDAHLHLPLLGALEREVDLAGAKSEPEAVARVVRAAAKLPRGTWVRGRNWDQNAWPGGRYPTRTSLDAALGDRPAALARVDGHSLWVNGAALARAGITRRTPTPAGGHLRREPSGEPSGVLVDAAMEPVLAVLPKPTRADLARDLESAMRRCAEAGLTGVHDMGTTPETLGVLEELAAAGRLPLRVSCYLLGTPEALGALLRRPPRRDGLLRVLGVKLLLDGALGSHGAALTEPYADAPELRGLLLHEREALSAWVERACSRGYQLALHAIGDRANALALDLIEEARELNPARHRIEHAQIVPPALVGRFAATGAVASVQPLHAVEDRHFAPSRLGPERLTHAYPLRRFAAHGVPLAFGSDAPIASEGPWRGFVAAVHRRDHGGEPRGGFLGAEAVTPAQALAAYTSGAALASGDLDLGRIAPGMLADLTVVDRDPLAGGDAQSVAGTRTLLTVVAGRPVAGVLA